MAYKRPKAQLLNTSRMSISHNIQKNTLFEARVKGLADTGSAVVDHPCGLLFFVAGAWLGELVKVRVTEVKSRFGLAELVEVLEPSNHRVEPPCQYHGCSGQTCGGCSWMFVDYEAQLQAKQDRVAQAIRRFDEKAPVLPILGSGRSFGYRVRAQLKTNGKALGFVANGKRELVSVKDCLVLTTKNRATLSDLNGQLPKKEWQPSSRKKQWLTLDIDESINVDSVSVNQRLPFQQANSQQNQVMRTWLKDKVEGINKDAKVLELFSGSGNFTQVLSQAGFNNIVAVEAVAEAIDALTTQQLPGINAEVCNLFDEEAFERLFKKHKDAETLVLDPPRDGLKVKQGLFKKSSKIRNVIYISCDLATLCRDLRDFKKAGYSLIEVQPLDLTPQTPHVEVLTHLRKCR